MDILFYRYGSICEPDMIQSFRDAGITVIEESTEISDKSIDDKVRLNLVEKHLKSHNFLFVFSINFYPVISNLCNIYKVPYLCWTVDCPIPELFNQAITNDTNRIFMFDKAQYEIHRPYNPNRIFHLPLASATDRFDEVISSITKEDTDKFSSEISFVGSLYTEKDPVPEIKGLSEYALGYMEALTYSGMSLYGCNILSLGLNNRIINEIKTLTNYIIPNAVEYDQIDRFIVSNCYLGYHNAAIERTVILNELAKYYNVDLYTRSDVSELKGVHVHPGVRTLDEMPKVFNLSKINLNMTIRPIETGLPLRCFDIIGCGGFLMTNYQSEIEDHFVIGQDLEAYSSVDELIDKCAFYLEHDDIRIKIAQSGYEKVKKEHSYFDRMKKMLEVLI